MNKFNGACLSFLVCAGLLLFSCSDFYNDLKNSGAQVVTPATSSAPTQTPAADPESAPTPTPTPSPSSSASGAYTKIGTQTINGVDYDIVTFGLWPQTIKAENVTVDENETESHGVFTYCKGSDGKWYVKADETNNYSGRKYSDGTSVAIKSDNSYKWFRVEPIKWRVLTVNYDHDKDFSTTGVKLLLAENVLTGMHFHDSWCNSHAYEKSEVRAWLTGAFYNSAFSTAEQAAIMTSTLDDLDASSNTDAIVTDKVFLLSYEEATTTDYGFAAEAQLTGGARACDTTDFVKAVGAWDEWWLRTCCGGMLFTVSAGCIYCDSCVYYDNVGVVPALCVAN